MSIVNIICYEFRTNDAESRLKHASLRVLRELSFKARALTKVRQVGGDYRQLTVEVNTKICSDIAFDGTNRKAFGEMPSSGWPESQR